MNDNPFRGMYLRPGNLIKDFRSYTLTQEISDVGMPISKYVPGDVLFRGALTSAGSNVNERMKHLWDQDQHSLTHTIVARGEAKAKKGDMVTTGERAFYILAVDEVGSLGATTIYYVEERNDLK